MKAALEEGKVAAVHSGSEESPLCFLCLFIYKIPAFQDVERKRGNTSCLLLPSEACRLAYVITQMAQECRQGLEPPDRNGGQAFSDFSFLPL